MVGSESGEVGRGAVAAKPTSLQDSALIRTLLERVAQDLGAILGRELVLTALDITRARSRPAGRGQVHISFKLGLTKEGGPKRFGALLVPLPEAITMAGCLLMLSEETLAARREESTLDLATKDALLEIGNVIGAAGGTALAALGAAGWSLQSEGCQGVRAGVRPAFPYEEGSDLVVARIGTTFDPFPPFELLLMLPPVS
jgi:hypothetical protein